MYGESLFIFIPQTMIRISLGILSDIIRTITSKYAYKIEDNKVLEDLYTALEKMFYIRGMSILDIMSYAHKIGETDNEGGFFFRWAHYLDLCDKLHIDNKYPKNFLFETNKILELAGENADIFDTGYVGFNEPYIRNGRK